MVYYLPDLRPDFEGFRSLAQLAAATDHLFEDALELRLTRTTLFDTSMSAPLGVILRRVVDRLNWVTVTEVPPTIARTLRRNRFLRHYGFPPLTDPDRTSIPFRRFRLADESEFWWYLHRHLRDGEALDLPTPLRRAIARAFLEMHANAVAHSGSRFGAYASGQLSPTEGRIRFTLCDGGVGIRDVVRRYFGNDTISSEDALLWAVRRSKSTRRTGSPAGLGLHLIRRFVERNSGTLLIVSRSAAYRWPSAGPPVRSLDADFPGTSVTLDINTSTLPSPLRPPELR